MNRALLAAGAAAALALPASADALTFTPEGAIPRHELSIERAVSYQVNRQVARYWPVSPVTFGTGGIPVVYASARMVADGWIAGGGDPAVATAVDGYHLPNEVVINRRTPDLSTVVSHEIVETEADPDNMGTEIADPVQYTNYWILGVRVSNWVKPDGQPFIPTTAVKGMQR